MLRQNSVKQTLNDQTRISSDEMRKIIELYDQQTGLLGSSGREATMSSETVSGDTPTVADVAELLGISPLEAQSFLMQAREAEKARAERVSQLRKPPPPPPVTTFTQNVAPQQVTVVQNVIVDSYAHIFEKYEANHGGYAATWNWGAFWFGPLWYFYKGMWGKALLYTFVFFFTLPMTVGVSSLVFPLILALIGSYDYYLLRVHRTQMWDRKRTVTVVNPATGSFARTNNMPGLNATPAVAPVAPMPLNTEEGLDQTARKLQVLRETYERGLLSLAEYEEKRFLLLNEVENRADLKRLEEAHRLGLLSDEEYLEKRLALLRR